MPRQFIDHPLPMDLVFSSAMRNVKPHPAGKEIMMFK